jgi:hypothetical protein
VSTRWYALVDTEVVGPFDTLDAWYHAHGGPDWRFAEMLRTGVDPWRVARTELGDGRAVSTVFLGLDHWWMDMGSDFPVHVFETMVVPDCDDLWRYSTWDEAVAGHDEVVLSMRDTAPPPMR